MQGSCSITSAMQQGSEADIEGWYAGWPAPAGVDAGAAQMQALMQIIGNATPQAALEIQRQLTAGAGPFTLQGMQVPSSHLLMGAPHPPTPSLMCAQSAGLSTRAILRVVQGSDPGSGSGRTDQDAAGKGDENLALTEEDLQARRIKVSGYGSIVPEPALLLPCCLLKTNLVHVHFMIGWHALRIDRTWTLAGYTGEEPS